MNLETNYNFKIGTFKYTEADPDNCHGGKYCYCKNQQIRNSQLIRIFKNSRLTMIFLQNVSEEMAQEWGKELAYKVIQASSNNDWRNVNLHVMYDSKKLVFIDKDTYEQREDGENEDQNTLVGIFNFLDIQTKKTIRVANCHLPKKTYAISEGLLDYLNNEPLIYDEDQVNEDQADEDQVEEDQQNSQNLNMENEGKVEEKQEPVQLKVDFKVVVGFLGEDADERYLNRPEPSNHLVFSSLKKHGYQFDGNIAPTYLPWNVHSSWIWVQSSLEVKLSSIKLYQRRDGNTPIYWEKINKDTLVATQVEFPLNQASNGQELIGHQRFIPQPLPEQLPAPSPTVNHSSLSQVVPVSASQSQEPNDQVIVMVSNSNNPEILELMKKIETNQNKIMTLFAENQLLIAQYNKMVSNNQLPDDGESQAKSKPSKFMQWFGI